MGLLKDLLVRPKLPKNRRDYIREYKRIQRALNKIKSKEKNNYESKAYDWLSQNGYVKKEDLKKLLL